MDFSWESILNNPMVTNVVNKAANSVLGVKQTKTSAPAATPQVTVESPVADSGMSKTTMIMIGAGVLVVVGGLFFFMRKK